MENLISRLEFFLEKRVEIPCWFYDMSKLILDFFQYGKSQAKFRASSQATNFFPCESGPSDGLLVALSGPTGRVLRYDPKRKSSEVLVDRVSFANGIVLSHKEDFLLYTESGTGQ